MKAVVGAHMKEYRNKWQTTAAWTIPVGIGSMVTHFQLPPYDIIEPTGNLGILLSVPTLYAPDFSLRKSCKKELCGQYETSFRNYPVQNGV